MKKHNRKSSLSTGILLFTIGCIFTTLGIAILVITIKGLITAGDFSIIGWGIIMPILFIFALLGFGITALVMGGKRLYIRIRQSITYGHGKEGTAKVLDCKSVSFDSGGNIRVRYALILAYNDNGEDKTFTTDYLFDVNECKFLQKLGIIKVKKDGNFIAVCEPFPEDIYKVDSVYGIETTFFKQKSVAILLLLWKIFFFVSLIFLITSFIIRNSIVTQSAIIILFAINFLFAISLAVCFIIWLKRKK